MGAYFKQQTASIAVDGHTSNAIYLGNKALSEIRVPANTEGANIAFLRSDDGVAFSDAYDETNALMMVPFTAGRAVSFTGAADLGGARYIKLRTADADGANVVQAGAIASITVVTRRW